MTAELCFPIQAFTRPSLGSVLMETCPIWRRRRVGSSASPRTVLARVRGRSIYMSELEEALLIDLALSAVSFIVSDGWAGSLQFQCDDKLDNKFSFFFNRTYNSIVGEIPFTGSAKAWFDDDVTKTVRACPPSSPSFIADCLCLASPTAQAGMGENLESGTLGVDVFTSCPKRQ